MEPDIAQEKKNEIILATLQCIKKKGYSHFSMQDVAKLSGVSKGIIHYYFLLIIIHYHFPLLILFLSSSFLPPF